MNAITAKSIKGVPQAEIARMLANAGVGEVARPTVGEWIAAFAPNGKSSKEPAPSGRRGKHSDMPPEGFEMNGDDAKSIKASAC